MQVFLAAVEKETIILYGVWHGSISSWAPVLFRSFFRPLRINTNPTLWVTGSNTFILSGLIVSMLLFFFIWMKSYYYSMDVRNVARGDLGTRLCT